VGKRTKTTCEGEQQVCRFPHLGYPDRFLRVVLQIHRIDFLFVGSGVCRCGA